MIEKNLAWWKLGQQHCLNFRPHSRHGVCSVQAKLKKSRLAEDDQWPGGCHDAKAAPPTVRPKALLIERTQRMSRSEFERENIVAPGLSVAASKPADLSHAIEKHTFRPPAEGMYDPALEKDSCGVGFIANIKGKKSHQIVSDALSILCNLEIGRAHV